MSFHDVRFSKLARKLGLKKPEYAIGAMLPIWFHCTQFGVYEISADDLELLSGRKNFDEILVSCGLAEKKSEGKFYISGSRGRVEWLTRLRENGKHGSAGGRPKKTKAKDNNDIKTQQGFVFKTLPTPIPALATTPVLVPINNLFNSSDKSSNPAPARVDALPTDDDLEQLKAIDRTPLRKLGVNLTLPNLTSLYAFGVSAQEIRSGVDNFAQALGMGWQPTGGFKKGPKSYFLGAMIKSGRFEPEFNIKKRFYKE